MPAPARRYKVMLSILIEEEDAAGKFVGIGYATTGGNDGLEQEVTREAAQIGWGEIGEAAPEGRVGHVAGNWLVRMPEEFGETILSEPDPVVWSEHDTLLDALLEIQAIFAVDESEDESEEAVPPPASPAVIFMATKVTDPKETAQRLFAELQRQIEERRGKTLGDEGRNSA